MDNEKGHTALHKAAAYKYVAYSQKMLLDIYSDNVQQTNDEMIIFLLNTWFMIIITYKGASDMPTAGNSWSLFAFKRHGGKDRKVKISKTSWFVIRSLFL